MNRELATFPCDAQGASCLTFSTEGLSLAYSRDGRWVAAGNKTVLLVDARKHETIARFGRHENTLFKAAFSPDSRCLAPCSRDPTVRRCPLRPHNLASAFGLARRGERTHGDGRDCP
jgi:hypothetical protein